MTQIVEVSEAGGGSAAPRYRRNYRRSGYRSRRGGYRSGYRRGSYRSSYRRGSYRRRRRQIGSFNKMNRLSRFQVAQADPFDAEAVGCKIPDANSMPSCPLQVCDTKTLTTDATYGATVCAIRPFASVYAVDSSAPTAATTWGWTAAYGGAVASTRNSAITANFTLVRPVAHGCRLTSGLSPNSVTGYVHVAIFAGNFFGASTWDFPTNVSQMTNGTIYKKIPLAQLCTQSVTVVNRSVDFSNERYVASSSNVVGNAGDLQFQTTGWGTIIIAVEGAPVSVPVLQIENLIHLEAIPLKSGIADASSAAAYSPQTLADVTNGQNKADPIILSNSNEGEVRSARLPAFMQGMMDTLGDVGSRVAYRAGTATAQYAVGAAASAAQAFLWRGNPAAHLTLRND
nr:MAG: capsid protein [Cressdnaviricota sp.]